MMGALLALALMLSQASPGPSATAPPVIIEVHSRGSVCAALKARIGPSVAALLQNDAALWDGIVSMRKMGSDANTRWGAIDRLHLENDISKVIHNMDAIQGLLSAPEPPDIDNDDARRIETMEAALTAVANEQIRMVNVLHGTLATSQANDAQQGGSGSGMSYGAQSDGIPDFAHPSTGEQTHGTGTAMEASSIGPGPGRDGYQTLGDVSASAMPDIRNAEKVASTYITPAATECAP
jgi:hypothetical protein